MYAGNHSPCHPLDTLLEAALKLKTLDDIAFCFVGGGSEHARVKQFALRHALGNVRCLPYQPLNELAGLLSAADLHVVVMGDEFVGIVHPSKIYNIMAVGTPALYVGPQPSHITDLATQNSGRFLLHRHGDVDGVVLAVSEEFSKWKAEGRIVPIRTRSFLRPQASRLPTFETGRCHELQARRLRSQERSFAVWDATAEGERDFTDLKTDFSRRAVLPQLISAIGGNTVENLFRSLPDSDNRFTDYHAAH
jgi:hypothetical protein